MSQDLFAAFGEAQGIVNSTSACQDAEPSDSHPDAPTAFLSKPDSSHTASWDDEDDDFGDFEDASVPVQPSTSSQAPRPLTQAPARPVPVQKSKTIQSPTSVTTDTRLPFARPESKSTQKEPDDPKIGRHPFADHMDFLFSGGDDEYDAGEDDLDDLSKNPEAAMAYSKKLIAARAQESHQPKAQSKHPVAPSITKADNAPRVPNKLKKKSGYAPALDSNVLFDADEAIKNGVSDSDVDDFGDFEAGPSSHHAVTQTQSSLANFDLLGLEDAPAPPPAPVIGPSRKHMNASSTVTGPKASMRSDPPPPQPKISTFDNAWDDFEETTPAPPPINTAPEAATRVDTQSPKKTPAENALPPTNIPPPAILLSAFPALLRSAQDTLLDPLSKVNAQQRQQLLKHPATAIFLRDHLNNAVVLGHIIAGRKLRWKRDQALAQGMRIGPAGMKSGMKLAVVDKSEAVKEDREVLDVLRIWKAQSGKFRSAVPSLGPTKVPFLVPDLAEQMPVRTLKVTEGGFVAPHACALCGLKREERVAKVDVDVDDSFGEWWVESMSMHVSCQKFWEKNKDKLRSR